MLTFLKLGGALLTDKRGRFALRAEVLARLAGEVAAWASDGRGQLVLAHGSGSFAHLVAAETDFLQEPDDALAFAKVAAAARALGVQVVAALVSAGLPAVMVPGGLLARCRDGEIDLIRAELVGDLLSGGRLPVIYGDVAADVVRGGAIASTEPLLVSLAEVLRPRRVLLATDVPGVLGASEWERLDRPKLDGPRNGSDTGADGDDGSITPIPCITADNLDDVLRQMRPAAGVVDVTGGMASKVSRMVELVTRSPETTVSIFSGLVPGAVRAALAGQVDRGTTISRPSARR